ncbi:hypothetical protein FGIG_08807 [Fasciola gigantica]|uniref:CUB domain-containing protein n=1 Tax=Fasciola gigantica TaxID=46835 RepID=A0A504YI00_FASGI|nr:hypothetical protein FGIG_08807 [Fasciola gigantica]
MDKIPIHRCSHSQIGTEQGKCVNDYITVGDTGTELPHPRYTACGNKSPTWAFYSTGNRATMKLLVTSELKNVTIRADITESEYNDLEMLKPDETISTIKTTGSIWDNFDSRKKNSNRNKNIEAG